MDTKELGKFFVKAKVRTYASSGEGGDKLLSDGSKEFRFKEKIYEYRDVYFGFNPFIGQEIVFRNEQAVLGMNYYGSIISETVPPKEIYQFLKEALRSVPKDKPFRGPKRFKKGNFEYFNKIKGSLERFEGQEKIIYKTKKVYELNYHGGVVTKK